MILLDTHTIVWWLAGGARLSARASREIAGADRILVSPISCWEVAMLHRKRTLALDRDVFEWIHRLFELERVAPATLSPQVAAGAGLLGPEFPGDPADRFIYCTARELPAPLVTKDRALRRYARARREVKTIW